ncbi:MAG: hypothetical protein HY232_18330 [Acidobacteria bacterium]|nr:hypothetical protein [Acidobacteriota bacterium]
MKPLNWKTSLTLFLGICWLFLSAVSAEDGEKKVKMKDLPPAVQQTVKQVSQGATLRGLARETENGKVFYEVELTVNGRTKDVLLDESGGVVVIEEEVALESLPQPARSAIEQKAGGGKILKVESITKGNAIVTYEAIVKASGKNKEIKVAPDGALVNK